MNKEKKVTSILLGAETRTKVRTICSAMELSYEELLNLLSDILFDLKKDDNNDEWLRVNKHILLKFKIFSDKLRR